MRTAYDADTGQLDITAPADVEVAIRSDGSVLWINIDGICAVRLCRIGRLTVEDSRPEARRSRRPPRYST